MRTALRGGIGMTTSWVCGALLALAAVGMAAAPAGDKPLAKGDPAPAFTLQGSDGKLYSLDDFRGRKAVVIAWFPKAFTGG
jgi:peroxiredoxin Q/BCP